MTPPPLRASSLIRALCLGAASLASAHLLLGQASVGVALGGSTYFGDLAPASPLEHLRHLGPSYGAFFRAPLAERLRVRVFVQRGRISGDDARRESTRARNLSFASDITEVGAGVEAHARWGALRPYVFGGVSVYRFGPRTAFEGEPVDLQPLGTEGQGSPGYPEPYALTRVALPLAAGVELALSDQVAVGVETGSRATFFDHLDDVSGAYPDPAALGGEQARLRRELADRRVGPAGEPLRAEAGGNRGDASDNDWFGTATVTVTYTFAEREVDEREPVVPCYEF